MQIWKYDDFLKVSFRYEWGGGGVCFVLGYFILFAFLSSTQIYTAVCSKVTNLRQNVKITQPHKFPVCSKGFMYSNNDTGSV